MLWLAVCLSLCVIVSKNIILSVLSLVGSIVCSSLFLFDLGLNYVGIVYLLVYVGAVLILLIFVVLSVSTVDYKSTKNVGLWSILWLVFLTVTWVGEVDDISMSSLNEELVGAELLGSNSVNLLIVSLLLFLAIVGSIAISL